MAQALHLGCFDEGAHEDPFSRLLEVLQKRGGVRPAVGHPRPLCRAALRAACVRLLRYGMSGDIDRQVRGEPMGKKPKAPRNWHALNAIQRHAGPMKSRKRQEQAERDDEGYLEGGACKRDGHFLIASRCVVCGYKPERD